MDLIKGVSLFILLSLAFVLVTYYDVEPTFDAIFIAVVGVIGTASLLVQTLSLVTKVTPSTKDDELVSGFKLVLAHIQSLLDLLSFNLSKDKARPTKSAVMLTAETADKVRPKSFTQAKKAKFSNRARQMKPNRPK